MVLDDSVLRRSNALQEMLRLARSIVADGEVSDMEAKVFLSWIDRHPDMLGVWPVSEVARVLRKTLADGRLSASERDELQELLERVAGDAKTREAPEDDQTSNTRP
jgi:hypothetical protein